MVLISATFSTHVTTDSGQLYRLIMLTTCRCGCPQDHLINVRCVCLVSVWSVCGVLGVSLWSVGVCTWCVRCVTVECKVCT